jgi:hypothetical protein
MCLNHGNLNDYLTRYRQAKTPKEKKSHGMFAMFFLHSLITLARRNFGSLHLVFGKGSLRSDWGPSMRDHILSFSEYHLEKIERDIVAMLPKTKGEEFLSYMAKYELARENIAEMDISRILPQKYPRD